MFLYIIHYKPGVLQCGSPCFKIIFQLLIAPDSFFWELVFHVFDCYALSRMSYHTDLKFIWPASFADVFLPLSFMETTSFTDSWTGKKKLNRCPVMSDAYWRLHIDIISLLISHVLITRSVCKFNHLHNLHASIPQKFLWQLFASWSGIFSVRHWLAITRVRKNLEYIKKKSICELCVYRYIEMI